MDWLQEVAVEDEFEHGKDAVDGVDRVVLPVTEGSECGASAEHGPVDDRDDEVVGDDGGVEEPMEVAPPRGSGFEPGGARGCGLAEVVDGPDR